MRIGQLHSMLGQLGDSISISIPPRTGRSIYRHGSLGHQTPPQLRKRESLDRKQKRKTTKKRQLQFAIWTNSLPFAQLELPYSKTELACFALRITSGLRFGSNKGKPAYLPKI